MVVHNSHPMGDLKECAFKHIEWRKNSILIFPRKIPTQINCDALQYADLPKFCIWRVFLPLKIHIEIFSLNLCPMAKIIWLSFHNEGIEKWRKNLLDKNCDSTAMNFTTYPLPGSLETNVIFDFILDQTIC